MIIVALDLSLTSSGVCDHNGPRLIKGYGQGMTRLARLRDDIRDATIAATVVVIEGYSFGSARGPANRAHQAGELGGVVRLMLHDLRIPYVDVPPANLKQYIAGKGNASKEAVLAGAIRRLGYEGSSTDEADALVLWHAAMDHYEVPHVTMPAQHRAALAKIQWPVIGERVAS